MSLDLEPLQRASWGATPSEIAMCQAKGQSERLCRNYVRVLHSYGENQLYACGTNAFQPSCSWRQVSGRPRRRRHSRQYDATVPSKL